MINTFNTTFKTAEKKPNNIKPDTFYNQSETSMDETTGRPNERGATPDETDYADFTTQRKRRFKFNITERNMTVTDEETSRRF